MIWTQRISVLFALIAILAVVALLDVLHLEKQAHAIANAPPAELSAREATRKNPASISAESHPAPGDPGPARSPSVDRAVPARERASEIGEEEKDLEAALATWAAKDPDAAATWALAQIAIPRGAALAAVVRGAIADPDEGEKFVARLAAENPELVAELGSFLVSAYSRAGQHERAALFAAGGAEALRTDWIRAAYDEWARAEPEAALDMAMNLDDPDVQRAAFQAAVHGWARADPQRLTECAAAFPTGPEKDFALLVSLRAWRAREPAAVTQWLEKNPAALGPGARRDIIFED